MKYPKTKNFFLCVCVKECLCKGVFLCVFFINLRDFYKKKKYMLFYIVCGANRRKRQMRKMITGFIYLFFFWFQHPYARSHDDDFVIKFIW